MFFCNISYKIRAIVWNLVYIFLNRFAAKSLNVFHLTRIVSLLPCETWNAHPARATIELLDRETPVFIQPLWPANSPDLNPVDNSVWEILQEGVQNIHHWSAAIDDATDEWLPQWRDPAWPTPFSVAVSVHPDQWCMFCTPYHKVV